MLDFCLQSATLEAAYVVRFSIFSAKVQLFWSVIILLGFMPAWFSSLLELRLYFILHCFLFIYLCIYFCFAFNRCTVKFYYRFSPTLSCLLVHSLGYPDSTSPHYLKVFFKFNICIRVVLHFFNPTFCVLKPSVCS